MCHSAAHVPLLRRVVAWLQYVNGLSGEKLEAFRWGAYRVGPQVGIGVVQSVGGAAWLQEAMRTLTADQYATVTGGDRWPLAVG